MVAELPKETKGKKREAGPDTSIPSTEHSRKKTEAVKSRHRRGTIQLVVSVATLVLTPLIARYQIEKGFETWHRQQEYLEGASLRDLRLKLAQELSQFLTRMYFHRNTIDVKSLSLSVERALVKENKAHDISLAESFVTTIAERQNEYENTLVALHSTLDTVRYIYGSNVEKAADEFGVALRTDPYASFPDPNQVLHFLRQQLSVGRTPDETLSAFHERYASERENDPAMRSGRRLLSEMWKELRQERRNSRGH